MLLKKFIRSFVILAAVGSIVPFAFASGDKGATCPACHMALSAKKDAKHTVAVKIKGKTMYCCAACNMNKKAPTKHH